MKKHILLAVGLVALYMAAREYGINSMADLKRVLKPYIGALDVDEILALLNSDENSGSTSGGGQSPVDQSSIIGATHES